MKKPHIVIIGNGISGVTCARFVRKLSDSRITIISDETDFFFSRTALMYVYTGHLRFEDTKPYEDFFWEKNRIERLRDYVQKVDFVEKELHLRDSGTLKYDKLVLATGSRPNKFGWPGQDLKGVQGLYSYQDLQQMEAASQAGIERAVVVGGGLIGVEMAEMFHSRHIPTTLLVREAGYWSNVLPLEEAQLIGQHIQAQGIDLRLQSELAEILGDEKGQVRGIRTKAGEEISCPFVGLTVGVHPNIAFLRESALEIDRGILVDAQLQTNLPDVYAIGDCAQLRQPDAGRRAIEPIWYTGRMMGETLAYNLCGQPQDYHPGLWFNSAKFFDIEYQVYGQVPPKIEPPLDSLFWVHNSGQKSLRIVYDRESQVVKGFNLLGLRYRQEVCEAWLKKESTLQEVLPDLALANFDPEFFASYEAELLALYNQRFPEQKLKLRSRRGLSAVLRFLGKGR